MPLLMITCPRKQESLPTNRILRAEDFAAADLGPDAIGPCPHCGGRHAWTKADTYFAGDPPKPPPSGRREDNRR